jgi:hypothetical protein
VKTSLPTTGHAASVDGRGIRLMAAPERMAKAMSGMSASGCRS